MACRMENTLCLPCSFILLEYNFAGEHDHVVSLDVSSLLILDKFWFQT